MTDAASLRAHALPVEEVARALDASTSRGLSAAEARNRLARYGANELEEQEVPSVWRAILGAVSEPFVLLLVAAGVGAVLLGEVRDGLFVLGGLIPIVGADVATAYRSERAMAELRNAVAPRAHVLRDGKGLAVPAKKIVPGDTLLLAAGDVVPADARVLPGGGLLVDRSVLTGESVPEQASSTPDPAEAPLADRRSMVFAGTSIVGGRGPAMVVATGSATELGAIAGTLGAEPRRRSPLQRELDRLVRILLIAAIALIIITVGLGFLRGQPAGANLLAGISAAIAAIPEEPPVLLAVILGLGAYRLMRRGVLVRRLAAQEALGAVDLIITDKTGTLTRNRLVVDELLRPDQPIDAGEANRLLLEALAAEEDAWEPVTAGRRGSFTQAIETALEERRVHFELDKSLVIASTGTADGRPYSTVRFSGGAGWRELALGAPEVVLAFDATMDDARRASWARLIADEAGRGGRLLLLAARERRGELSIVAGLLLIGIGIVQLWTGGFELPGTGRLQRRGLGASGESLVATYVLGLVFGVGGFCSGPLLGGVLTIAGASGGALAGALLLAVFAAGMAAPLFVLALVWDRLGTTARGRLRGREIQFGPLRRHSSVVISSLLFMSLGVAFVLFQGSNALSGVYEALGASDLALRIETGVRDLAVRAPLVLVLIIGVPVSAVVVTTVRVLRRQDGGTAEPGG